MMKKTMEKIGRDKSEGCQLRDIRFADDQGMVIIMEKGVRTTMDELNETAKDV